MGYTHYYYVKPEYDRETFSRIAADMGRMVSIYEKCGLRLGNQTGHGFPVTNEDEISFNGLVNCGHAERKVGLVWPAQGASGIDLDGTRQDPAAAMTWCAGRYASKRICGGDCSYEAFCLYRKYPEELLRETEIAHGHKGMQFDCTKTNYRPYDIAVNTALIIAKHHLKDGIVVKSDGEIDKWQDAMSMCQHMLGYGKEFSLD